MFLQDMHARFYLWKVPGALTFQWWPVCPEAWGHLSQGPLFFVLLSSWTVLSQKLMDDCCPKKSAFFFFFIPTMIWYIVFKKAEDALCTVSCYFFTVFFLLVFSYLSCLLYLYAAIHAQPSNPSIFFFVLNIRLSIFNTHFYQQYFHQHSLQLPSAKKGVLIAPFAQE